MRGKRISPNSIERVKTVLRTVSPLAAGMNYIRRRTGVDYHSIHAICGELADAGVLSVIRTVNGPIYVWRNGEKTGSG